MTVCMYKYIYIYICIHYSFVLCDEVYVKSASNSRQMQPSYTIKLPRRLPCCRRRLYVHPVLFYMIISYLLVCLTHPQVYQMARGSVAIAI